MTRRNDDNDDDDDNDDENGHVPRCQVATWPRCHVATLPRGDLRRHMERGHVALGQVGLLVAFDTLRTSDIIAL